MPTKKKSDPRRDAYRKAWHARLLPQLVADEWRWSANIAVRLGETNLKVRERLQDLVVAGVVERYVYRLPPSQRPEGLPTRVYFRLAVGKPPAPPRILPLEKPQKKAPRAFVPPSTPRVEIAPIVDGSLTRPIALATQPIGRALPASIDSLPQSVLDAVREFVLSISFDEKRQIIDSFAARNMVPSFYDRPLLAICGQRASRYLDFDEKRTVRSLFIDGVRALI